MNPFAHWPPRRARSDRCPGASPDPGGLDDLISRAGYRGIEALERLGRRLRQRLTGRGRS